LDAPASVQTQLLDAHLLQAQCVFQLSFESVVELLAPAIRPFFSTKAVITAIHASVGEGIGATAFSLSIGFLSERVFSHLSGGYAL